MACSSYTVKIDVRFKRKKQNFRDFYFKNNPLPHQSILRFRLTNWKIGGGGQIACKLTKLIQVPQNMKFLLFLTQFHSTLFGTFLFSEF